MNVGFVSTLYFLYLAHSVLALHQTPFQAFHDLDFHDPRDHGGSMLARFCAECPGEPLNVIISAQSDPYILTTKGLLEYIRTLGFEPECLNLHLGDRQYADLGDNRGAREEVIEIRQSYMFLPRLGTCIESVIGGNHLRAWKQKDSGAWFLGVSLELDVRHDHDIQPDGYDRGRDQLLENSKDSRGFKTHVKMLEGLLPKGSQGINHDIEIDGQVALLTVEPYLHHDPHPYTIS